MKNVFVLVGDYWHSAASIKPMVDLLFNDDWYVVYTEKPADLYIMAEKPDLVISFKDPIENDQIPTDVWCDEHWNDVLFDLVENNGTGLILAHAAVTDLGKDHPIIKQMIQSMFVSHPDMCPMSLMKAADHPVMDGITEFTFPDNDEQYQMEMLDDVKMLAHTKTKYGVQPAVWVRELGNGKVCCITPAHTAANLTCDGFIRLMSNAIKWCCI